MCFILAADALFPDHERKVVAAIGFVSACLFGVVMLTALALSNGYNSAYPKAYAEALGGLILIGGFLSLFFLEFD